MRHRITFVVAITFVVTMSVLGRGPGRSAGLDRYASTMNPAVRLTFFLNEPVSRLRVRSLTATVDIVTVSFWGMVFGRFAGLVLTREDGSAIWGRPRS